jgi:8-oxo-dGTP pyrophosphatase MutT (NUDIX family)
LRFVVGLRAEIAILAWAGIREWSLERECFDTYASTVPTRVEVAVFVTRRSDSEVLIVHRSPAHGGYWHVVAGGVEFGESVEEAAERELHEETGLAAPVTGGIEATEYVYSLTQQPAQRRDLYDPSVAQVEVTCFRVSAPDDWEPKLDWEHDDHRWCNPEEAFDVLRWPATAQALRQLIPGKPS